MAVFTFLDDTSWNSYSALAGGSILSRSATQFTYLSDRGFKITLSGNGFTYDASGLPTGGKITGLDVFLGATQLADYSRLSTNLTDYVTLALGQTSGSATETRPDITALYALMRQGDDVINGSNLGRNYDGFDGNDTLNGGAGDDWFYGGRGIDVYDGAGGNDGVSFLSNLVTSGVTISGATTLTAVNDGFGTTDTGFAGIEMLQTTNLADTVEIGEATDSALDTIWLMGGDDTISFQAAENATIYGGAGNDVIYGGSVIDGGEGVDQFNLARNIAFWSADANGHGAVVDLTRASGQIVDDGFGNTETAAFGWTYFGTRHDDHFTGSAFINAEFWGNGGRDTMEGGAGQEFLYGGDGGDVIRGGGGNDEVSGGRGRDQMSGGGGDDHLGFWFVDATGHGVIVDLSLATGQVIDDGYGNTETARRFETVSGSDFNDSLTGGTGANYLWGNAGDDTLSGGGGADTLVDGLGNDVLRGDDGDDFLWSFDGADSLTGGRGADAFNLSAATPGLGGADTITDMNPLADQIGIRKSWSPFLTGTALTSAQFIAEAGRTTAATATQLLIYDTTTGRLYFDADGSGLASSAVWVATLSNTASLTWQDFTLFS